MDRMLRQIAVRTLTFPGVMPLVQRWNRDLGVVFMLHRVADEEMGIAGQDPEVLRRTLAFLRRHEFRVVPVSELLEWARSPDRRPGPCVAFTLDDGYLDQATRAAPLFAEFDVPATIFPVTGFLDGDLWMWWDRLRYLVDRTDRRRVTLRELGGSPIEIGSHAARSPVLHALSSAMKRLTVADREERLAALSGIFDVELPTGPPPRYAPMSWDQARRCEEAGVRIGPHTVTHPTLSQESDERVRAEVAESWARLGEELEDPVSVFCYPNGCHGDFTRREGEILAQTGMDGALTAEPGYVSASGETAPARPVMSPYELPRYSFPDKHSSLVRIVSGLSPEARRRLSAPRPPPPSGGARDAAGIRNGRRAEGGPGDGDRSSADIPTGSLPKAGPSRTYTR